MHRMHPVAQPHCSVTHTVTAMVTLERLSAWLLGNIVLAKVTHQPVAACRAPSLLFCLAQIGWGRQYSATCCQQQKSLFIMRHDAASLASKGLLMLLQWMQLIIFLACLPAQLDAGTL